MDVGIENAILSFPIIRVYVWSQSYCYCDTRQPEQFDAEQRSSTAVAVALAPNIDSNYWET